MYNKQSQNSASKLLVVIVNYRTPNLIIECLKSMINEVNSLPGTNCVVIDNASDDGSAEQIQEAIIKNGWNDWVSLIVSERNGGYSYGNNIAISQALKSDHPPANFLLLNPDTIVRPAAFQVLVDFMDNNPKVGIAGSRLEDPDGTPQRSAFRFHTALSELDGGLRLGIVSKILSKWVVAPEVSDLACETQWVSGASMIVRREVFEQVGLMDEGYFLYFEEVDLCWRSQRAGWSCWYVPESRIVHLVGQSTGVTNVQVAAKRRPQYWFDSRRRYFLKNHDFLYAALADFLFLFGFILWRVRRVIQNKPDLDPPHFLADFWQNTVFVKGGEIFNQQTEQELPPTLGLWEQIKEDWIAHGRDWSKPGFRAVAVYRFGVWRMKIKSKLLRAPFSLLYRSLYRKVRNTYGIELPYTVKLGRRVIIEHQSGIVIHGNCVIGDDSIIRQGVTLGNRYLNRPFDAPKLGVRVNVGAGAKIFGNVSIGDDANIGANAVVLSDVPPGKTAVGIPAKVI